jgi:hypothetical protein
MKKNKKKILIIGIAFVSLVIFVLLLFTDFSSKSDKIKYLLEDGRLAPLPENAKNVQIHGWSGLFTGCKYIKFESDKNGIDQFINRSPSLQGVTPAIFNGEHMLLPYKKDSEGKNMNLEIDLSEDYYKHEYFMKPSSMPDWYSPTIKKQGRRFRIPAKDSHNWGEVIINDENNTVFIQIIWS